MYNPRQKRNVFHLQRPNNGNYWVPPGCAQETYVDPTYDISQAYFGTNPPVYPYFDIAAKYGFANYFFQTNQGPSAPAHDFLFGGTSAPAGNSALDYFQQYEQYYQEFAAGNFGNTVAGDTKGDCYYNSNQTTSLIFPNAQYTGNVTENPCFDHQTLVDLLDNATPTPLTWKYYARHYYDYWNAPSRIAHLCSGPGWTPGTPCNSAYYTSPNPNIVVPSELFFADVPARGTGLTTGQGKGQPPSCALPNVTWIIPNGSWSDHPGPSGSLSTTTELGPDWVANIISAVGGSPCIDEIGKNPWQDTVIFVVWDDWGGFYDHVADGLGAQFLNPQSGDFCFFSSGWGCGYTYGFRVPFLVVSQYTSPGYVSGDCTLSGGCPNTNLEFYHDFGSILAFIENNFSLGIGCINGNPGNVSNNGVPCNNGGGGGYAFADAYYPEQQAGSQYLPLGDLFNLWYGSENSICTNPNGCAQPFASITLASEMCGNVYCYGVQYFKNGGDGQDYDPDNDAIDND